MIRGLRELNRQANKQLAAKLREWGTTLVGSDISLQARALARKLADRLDPPAKPKTKPKSDRASGLQTFSSLRKP